MLIIPHAWRSQYKSYPQRTDSRIRIERVKIFDEFRDKDRPGTKGRRGIKCQTAFHSTQRVLVKVRRKTEINYARAIRKPIGVYNTGLADAGYNYVRVTHETFNT